MKKIKSILILSSLILSMFMTACTNENVDPDTKEYEDNSKSETTSAQTTTIVSPVSVDPEPLAAAKNKDLSSLDNTLIGYGQGVNVNKDNIPQGAIDFNEKYSKYDAYAYNEKSEADSKKTITLTFDQGYENGYTSKILDTLKEKNVKATFFVVGDYVEKNPELIKRMIDEGHTIGNHSLTHKTMPNISNSECEDEITSLHKLMKDKYNYEMTLFRAPKGEFSERTLALTQNLKYKSVFWSFAYADWDVNNQPDETQSLEKIKSAKHNGAIYLLHSVSKTNVAILGDVIDDLKSDGYSFLS